MADLTPKTIDELPEDSSISGSEMFAVMDGSSAKRMAMATIRNQFMMAATGTLANNLNIDELLTPGTYYVFSPSTVTGTPPATSNTPYKLFVVRGYTDGNSVARTWQIVLTLPSTATASAEHRRYYGPAGWSDWARFSIPDTNDAISTLQSNVTNLGNGNVFLTRSTASVSGNSTKEISLANSEFGVILYTGGSTAVQGAYLYYCGSSGDVNVKAISEASGLTLTPSTNKITVVSTSGWYAYGLMIKW